MIEFCVTSCTNKSRHCSFGLMKGKQVTDIKMEQNTKEKKESDVKIDFSCVILE